MRTYVAVNVGVSRLADEVNTPVAHHRVEVGPDVAHRGPLFLFFYQSHKGVLHHVFSRIYVLNVVEGIETQWAIVGKEVFFEVHCREKRKTDFTDSTDLIVETSVLSVKSFLVAKTA